MGEAQLFECFASPSPTRPPKPSAGIPCKAPARGSSRGNRLRLPGGCRRPFAGTGGRKNVCPAFKRFGRPREGKGRSGESSHLNYTEEGTCRSALKLIKKKKKKVR